MDKDIFFAQFGHLAHGPGGNKKMRDLILQLAVQGKLVEQDPNDETVDLLLDQIEAYRDNLVREKKIRKSKPFPEVMEDEAYFAIPTTWKWCRLGELGDWGAGATPNRKQSTFYGGSTPWFKSGELTGGVVTNSEETVTEEALQKTSLRVNMPGDVMVAMYGATIGKTAVAGVECTTNQAVCACTPFDGIFNEYLHIGLKAYRPIFTDQGAGGAQPNISRVKIIHTPFPLPPLAEQKRIVAKVDELMGLCDELEAQQSEHVALKRDCVASTLHHLTAATEPDEINTNWSITQNNFHNWFNDTQTIKSLRATILQLAVQGKLVPQDREDDSANDLLRDAKKVWRELIEAKAVRRPKELDEISADEELFPASASSVWCRYGDISVISSGVTKGRKLAGRDTMTVPYLRVANVQRGWIDTSVLKEIEIPIEELEKFSVRKGDVLQVEGGDWDKVGRAVVWDEDIDPCIHQNHIFKGRSLVGINPKYVEVYMNAPTTMGYFQSCSKQTTNLASINKTQLNNTPFLLPPLAEQNRIVAKVNELMALCDQLEAQIDTQSQLTQDLTASLIHHMTAA